MSCLFFLAGNLFPVQEDEIFPFEVTTFQLENGLQVILAEDYSLPLVSVVLAYNVGSINEPPKRTGLALSLIHISEPTRPY